MKFQMLSVVTTLLVSGFVNASQDVDNFARKLAIDTVMKQLSTVKELSALNQKIITNGGSADFTNTSDLSGAQAMTLSNLEANTSDLATVLVRLPYVIMNSPAPTVSITVKVSVLVDLDPNATGSGIRAATSTASIISGSAQVNAEDGILAP